MGRVSAAEIPALGLLAQSRSLVEVLRARAKEEPDRRAFTFLGDGEAESAALTYGELDERARALAARLQGEGLAAGERVLLLYPPSLEYIVAFWGCLYAGAVAVPSYPPGANRGQGRVAAVAADARPRAALTTEALLRRLGRRLDPAETGFGKWLVTDDLDLDRAGAWQDPEATPESLAFLQYTSGSTSLPKGVKVRHGNLLHNERTIQLAFGQGPGSVIVGWLPLYHDMGLIGNVLQPLLVGATCILMSPMSFLERPLRWLQAISRYRGTTSGGPNFAYDLCVRRIRPEERADLDLSSWSVAFNGAEPVRAETLDRFAQAFAPCGFRREAFFPCYGLAEATLFVSGGGPLRGPVVRSLAAGELERHRAVEVDAADPEARRFVGCGRAGQDVGLRVADPTTGRELPDGQVGEVWVSGPGVAGGYWNRPEESERTFGATAPDVPGERFLRTGDLGFRTGGELFITGRLKDLILLYGRNHYPQDLELTVERSHPALRPRAGAVFQVEAGGEERLVVVHELERRHEAEAAAAAEAVRRAVAEEHDVQVDDVVLVTAGAVPFTSSGKVQRRACRDAYLEDRLPVVLRSAIGEEPGESAPAACLDREALLAVEPASRAGRLQEDLRQRAARILRVAAAALEPAAPLAAAGLDSLGAAELRGELEAAFGVSLALPELLEERSLERLAGEILARVESGEAAGVDELPPPSGARSFPLSQGQRALWFVDRLAPESAAYNLAAAARVRGAFDPAALDRALAGVAALHPALSATFREEEGEPVQTFADAPVRLQEIDARGWSAAELRRRLTEEAFRPFDLARGPLLRLALVHLDGGEQALLFAVHHLVADFRSLALVLRDLGDLYLGRREAGAEPPGRGYVDFVAWQERRLADPASQRLWDYWLGQLAGDLRPLDLPTDRLRPAVQTWRGGSRPLSLTPDLSQRLRALARERGCTPFVLLLAAFQTVLHRYTGQGSLVVGSPAAGRTLPAWREQAGYFVNPLPLRADLGSDPGFGDLLSQVRRTVFGGLEHQDLPFALLAERLRPERDSSRPPVFQVMFVLQGPDPAGLDGLSAFSLGEDGARIRLGGLELESLALAEGREPFELSLAAAEGEAGFQLSLRYNRGLFDATTAARLLGHFATLLASAVEDPDRTAGSLSLLTAAERFQSLVEWSSQTLSWPRGARLEDAFREQARRTPERDAVVGREETLTYGELARRSTALARHLAGWGVGPEVRVGICLGRTPDLVVALLGVLEAGGAYVPLDPAYPPERLGFMVRDSGAAVVVTDRRSAAALPAETPRLFLDEPLLGEAGEPAPVAPGNLAYVIYTSGSTGVPKGVAIEHRAAVSFLAWAGEAFGAEELAGVLASTSICFDLSVFEIFAPLSRGGTVILAETALELPVLPAAPRVTLINTVPSAMAELLRSGPLPAALATVNLAGEPLPGSLADTILARPGVRRLLNLYGPSEDTTYSTWAEVGRDRSGAPTIGRPLANGRAYGLDARLEPVPVGISGELYLGGPGLARGYLDRPELTAERFLPDPFATEPGARLYRTGDLVRFRPDGEIDFLGRADHQVKVRGFRIEIGEVEAAIRSHPRVRDAVVVADRDPEGHLRLSAYWVREPGGEAAAAELRARLRERLPSYMVPALWIELLGLPRTPNGKVDRRALPAPEAVREERGGAGLSPVEDLLAELWKGLLGRRPQPGESFFDLGGHSLLALRLVYRVRSAFGVDLGPAAVLETPTLAGLAARIEAALGAGRPALPRVEPAPREARLPLSFAQQRLWFLDQLQPESTVYAMPAALRLRGRLAVRALAGALAAVAARHEVLRTVFPAPEGEPAQVVLPPAPVPLPVVDLAGLEPGPRGAEARRLAAGEAARPFDLAAGPLARFHLLRLDGEEHLLLVALHHIVFDGWSLEIFARELGAFYTGLTGGPAPDLPPLPVQYADYAVWQRGWLTGEALTERLAFWKERLGGAPAALELPLDRPRPAVRSFRGGAETAVLPTDLAEALGRLARSHNATPFMVFLAVLQSLLARYTNQDDVRVGSPVAGRPRPELEGLVGFFVNMVVLRADLSGAPSFSALLMRVRQTALEAYVHQELPFELLVEELNPGRDLSRQPLFEVVAAQGPAWPALELPGLEATVEEIATGHARFDLTAVLRETAGGWAVTLEHGTELFTAATVRRMLRHFEACLAGAAADPGRPGSELPLLTAGERHQILVEWNDTTPEASPERCVHEAAGAWARRSSGLLAVVEGERRLTYGELAARAGRLAWTLRARGVAASDRVGLCIERSLEMVVGALAVFQVGAAYVALDPASPEERLVHALKDSGARVLLARAPWALRLAGEAGAVPVILDETGPAPAEEAAPLPPGAGAGLDAPAYVIYTSGSTGRPKGVEVGHRSLASLVAWHQRVYEITPEDRTTLLAGPGFDASVWEMWPALAAGACLCLPAPEALSDPAGLWRWMAEHRITVSFLPTPLLEAVLREELSGSSLRAVLTGGDRLHRLPRPDLPFPLFNQYGPTESTVVTTWDRVAGEAEPPIGRPIDGARVYLLDRSLLPVPLGVAGELCAAGAGLAVGYLNRPELTAERFVPDPFAGSPGARMYRTGDLARRRADGRIEFLARMDHQVKIRGYRIELGEIESVLREHPAVREAVVVVAGSGLAAWIVPAGADFDGAELRRFLRARLPEYMVPATLSPLAKLPLTANGKVDRAALAVLGEASAGLPEGSAPRNGIEALLAELWCELLGREEVGVFDSFFALGGHSLQIARLVARVREVFGVELPVRSLFETSTIAELAEVVARRLIEQDEDEIDAVLAEMGMAGRAGFEEGLHG